MIDETNLEHGVDELYEVLDEYDVPPLRLQSGFPEFDTATKNAVVDRVAVMFDPEPTGRLLARLLYIRTDDNEAQLARIYIANLRAIQPDARKFSLYGLSELKHRQVRDFALAALRDEADEVVAMACEILLPAAQKEPTLWRMLQSVYRARKDQPRFHITTSLLTSSGIERDEPPTR